MQFALNLGENIDTLSTDFLSFHDIIVDRKSKYSVSGGCIKSEEEKKDFLNKLRKDLFFKKATHNSYAYRIVGENGAIIEGKNDDGEMGAGICILREMQREDAKNMILVVTRYFGGIHLQSDRFKHIIDASKYFFGKINNL